MVSVRWLGVGAVLSSLTGIRRGSAHHLRVKGAGDARGAPEPTQLVFPRASGSPEPEHQPEMAPQLPPLTYAFIAGNVEISLHV